MSEKTREVPQVADTTYTHTLVIDDNRLRQQVGVTLWFSPTLPLILRAMVPTENYLIKLKIQRFQCFLWQFSIAVNGIHKALDINFIYC